MSSVGNKSVGSHPKVLSKSIGPIEGQPPPFAEFQLGEESFCARSTPWRWTRDKPVRTLTAALHQQNPALREAAREALREFVDRSEIPADTAALLTVRGVMGAMLSAATGREGSGAAVEHLVRIAEDGCGGVQPAVLAAVEIAS